MCPHPHPHNDHQHGGEGGGTLTITKGRQAPSLIIYSAWYSESFATIVVPWSDSSRPCSCVTVSSSMGDVRVASMVASMITCGSGTLQGEMSCSECLKYLPITMNLYHLLYWKAITGEISPNRIKVQ